MNDRQIATAAPVDIQLGGQAYRMNPLNERDIAELDNYLRGVILNTARDSLPSNASPEQRRITEDSALRLAMSISWTTGEGARMMSTISGWARILWQGLKHNHPELKPKDIEALLFDPRTLEAAKSDWERLNVDKKKATKTNQSNRRKKKRATMRERSIRPSPAVMVGLPARSPT